MFLFMERLLSLKKIPMPFPLSSLNKNAAFLLQFEIFGIKVKRRARVLYDCNPDWEYFSVLVRGIKEVQHESVLS